MRTERIVPLQKIQAGRKKGDFDTFQVVDDHAQILTESIRKVKDHEKQEGLRTTSCPVAPFWRGLEALEGGLMLMKPL